MKYTIYFLFLSALAIFPKAAAAEQPLRCPNATMPADRCEETRKKAIQQGCIDAGTYYRLLAENRFPACIGSTFVGDCPCGCFAEETTLDVLSRIDGDRTPVAVKDLFSKAAKYDLVALNGPSLTAPKFQTLGIKESTIGDESQPLVVLELSNGKKLRLTEKHAVLVASGKLITARELTKGDTLVDREGNELRITKLSREKYDRSVYNFQTDGKDAFSHIIVAEGTLVGDLYWQNRLEEETDGIALRK